MKPDTTIMEKVVACGGGLDWIGSRLNQISFYFAHTVGVCLCVQMYFNRVDQLALISDGQVYRFIISPLVMVSQIFLLASIIIEGIELE